MGEIFTLASRNRKAILFTKDICRSYTGIHVLDLIQGIINRIDRIA